ncbi:MAG: regulator [Ferroplasma sp.]|uniref:regulator n=1 Tax=Ferroplasma sp. TaxID=2591003 RepID=UPI002815AC94|nr:regulator [Ferroplasma sp.]WMT50958.1 MAG: regulator [Ferroplasma sp.]
MWDYINQIFQGYPAEMKVIQKMTKVGISVKIVYDEPKLFCDAIEIKPNSIARAYNVDRRVIVNLIQKVISDKRLYDFFSNLSPVSNFENSGSKIGFGVIEIIPVDAGKPGIIAGVMKLLADNGISVRQVITDDPDLIDNPRAIIVTTETISGSVLNEIKKVNGVKAVLLL